MQDKRLMTTISVLLGLDAEEAMETDSPPSYSKPSPPPPTQKPAPPKPESNLPENKKLANEEKLKGNEFYKKKEFVQALEHYNAAVAHDPTDITYYNNIAAVYFEQKEFKQCVEQCEKAIEIGRENRADYKLIAKAFMRIGEYLCDLINTQSFG